MEKGCSSTMYASSKANIHPIRNLKSKVSGHFSAIDRIPAALRRAYPQAARRRPVSNRFGVFKRSAPYRHEFQRQKCVIECRLSRYSTRKNIMMIHTSTVTLFCPQILRVFCRRTNFSARQSGGALACSSHGAGFTTLSIDQSPIFSYLDAR